MSVLTIDNLCVYSDKKQLTFNVSVDASAGELIGLIGPNGAGKTSFLKAIAQLVRYTGSIHFKNHNLLQLNDRKRAQLIGYLPQGSDCAWPLTVRRLVTLGRIPHLSPWDKLGASDHAAIEDALEKADVEKFADSVLTQLSGGEKSRALLARLLAVQAPLVLADEPIASLDPLHQINVMKVLQDYAKAGNTVIVVLHDLLLATRFCDRLALLKDGHLIHQGPPQEVLTPDNIQEVYHVSTVQCSVENRVIQLPWNPV